MIGDILSRNFTDASNAVTQKSAARPDLDVVQIKVDAAVHQSKDVDFRRKELLYQG